MSCALADCGVPTCPVCQWSRPGMAGSKDMQMTLKPKKGTK